MEISYESVDSGLKTAFAAELLKGKYDIVVPTGIDLEDIADRNIGHIELREGRFYFSPNADIKDRYQLWGRFFRKNNRKYLNPGTDTIFLYNGEGRPIGSIKIRD